MRLSVVSVTSRLGGLLCAAFLLQNTAEFLYLMKLRTPEQVSDVIAADLKSSAVQFNPEYAVEVTIQKSRSRFLPTHVWLVPLWLLLCLIQSSAWIRRHKTWLHRWSGRLMLSISTIMMLSLVLMTAAGEKFVGEQEFYVQWDRPDKFFTFISGTFFLMPYWLLCMAQAYRYAAYRTIEQHRWWAMQFMYSGMVPGSFRILGFAYTHAFYSSPAGPAITKDIHDPILGYSMWASIIFNCMLGHQAYLQTKRPLKQA